MKLKIGKKDVLFLIPVIIFLSLWEIAGNLAHTPLFPPLSRVLAEMFRLLENGILLKSLEASLLRVLAGYILGSLFGLFIGILMGISRIAEYALRPLISMLFPIPILGWLPLLMLWIGINEALPITLIFICTFFPVAYNTFTGIREVKAEYIKAARTLGASDWFIFWHVIFPLALPNIFTGLRLEAGMAWRSVIAAEMFAIPVGIGALLMNGENLIRVDIIMTCLIVLSIMSVFFEYIFIWLEKKTTGAWR
ncbi:ABC transporter permease [Thermosyntropha sp.]|uniref:ABC transporter permease n=1 Tax=Thermosyntropha sp. TaxID=2740820 RepID=UPI0025ECD05B|nr:ABC transporter permease [Thermosyntropha sp.]MBO8158237.1 ABC transporter permease [Thermosyntropha sp.]